METQKVKQIANLTKFIHKMSSKRENPNRFRLYDITGISPTISCMKGGGLEPLILLEMKDEAKINIVGKWPPNSESNGNVYETDGLSPTITCGAHGGCEPSIMYKDKLMKNGDGFYSSTSDAFFRGGLEGISRTIKASVHDASVVQNFRIRKLTERECFRLMGVRDADIDKIKAAGISKTQQYKLAGNSIVCDVLMGIFGQMFADDEQPLSLF